MRDAAMAAESLAQGVSQRDDHKRQRGYGENGMRNQKREVHRPDPALPPEANDPRVHVKINVEAEEKDRARERAQHGRPVPADFPVANECKSHEQKKSANRIQGSVNCRKRRKRNNCHVWAILVLGAVSHPAA